MEIQWRIIGELTDKTVLGTEGLSNKAPQRKSRAILVNEDGKYAVIYEMESDLYMLPGGSIEAGEDEVTALAREIVEETGCLCDFVEPLGIVSENRFHADSTRISYFFVVHTKSNCVAPNLTDEEKKLGTCLMWCTFDELLHRIRDKHYVENYKKFLQLRDITALDEYISSYLKGACNT